MSVHVSPGAYLSRTANLLSNGLSRTWMIWARRQTQVPSPPNYQTYFAALDALPGTYNNWAGVFPIAGFTELDIFNDITSPGTPESLTLLHQEPALGVWQHYAWVKTGNLHQFFINGVEVGNGSPIHFQDVPIVADVLGGDGYGGDLGDVDLIYERAWNTALSQSEIAAEMQSPTRVRTLNLQQNCPLETDLLDISGTARHWGSTGTIAFQPFSPFPDNSGALTAVDLGDVNLAPVLTAVADHDGATFPLWFKFTSDSDNCVGLFAYGDAATYTPSVQIYLGPASAPTLYLDKQGNDNLPILFTVDTAITYYVKVLPNGGNPSPANLTITAQYAPNLDGPAGTLFIPGDTGKFLYPAVFVSSVTGEWLNFNNRWPVGEAGDIFANGRMVFEDNDNFADIKIRVFSPQYQAEVVYNAASSIRIRTNTTTQRAWVATVDSPSAIRVLDNTGATVSTTSLAIAAPSTIATSPTEAILYYAPDAVGNAIKRWDLPGAAPLTDLAAAIPGYYVSDILGLPDGSIVAMYSTDGDAFVRHYAPSGTLLHTYNLGFTLIPGGTRPRLAASNADNDTTFWAWTHGDFGTSLWHHITVATGAIVHLPPRTEYEEGVYQGDPTATPLTRFQNAFSCPIVVLRAANAFTGTNPPPPPPPPPPPTVPVCPPQSARGPVDTGCIMPLGDF